jgi:hypothetical protein
MTSIGIQLETFNPTKIEKFINALDPLPFPNVKSNTFKVDSIVLTFNIIKVPKPFLGSFKILFQEVCMHTFGIVCHFAFPQSTNLVIVVNDNFKIIP